MAKQPFDKYVEPYNSGDVIYGEGDNGSTMFIVQSGKVRLHRTVDGQDWDLGVLEKGDFFGETALLEGMPRLNSATAVDDAELIEIGNPDFDTMIRGNMEIAVRLMRQLSVRLRHVERRNTELQLACSRSPAETSETDACPETIVQGAQMPPSRLETKDASVSFEISGPSCILGRFDPISEQRPDVDLTELDLKRTVSRRHASITWSDDGFVIAEETGAMNGTFVNGSRLGNGSTCNINDGDELGLGGVLVIFRC